MDAFGIAGRNSTTSVFHRFPKKQYPIAVAGDGPYVVDVNGKRYLDASGGAAVSSLGHSNRRVIDAIKRQVDSIAFAHTSFFTSEPAEELADLLAEAAPGDLNKVYLLTSGSEAVEAALKLARQYHVERGEPSRSKIISRLQSYHGNTLGALAAGGNIWRREKFGPLLVDVTHISPCYEYRDRRSDETVAQYGRRVADELEAAILAEGPENVMCFIAETVGGATLGSVPPVEGYFRRIREICDKYGVLLILDEVMCGMGRTGTLFACEQEGVVPDIVALAKGLGAGYQPIGAIMATDAVYDAVVGGSGFFQHGHTYTGHITACAAALEVQKVIRDECLLDNVRQRSRELMAALRERFGDHPNVGDIRGRGLFQSIEFVSDRSTKAPLDPSRQFAGTLKYVALDLGLICYPMGGLIDGTAGDHVMLAPPFIVESAHIEEIVDKLDRAIALTMQRTA
jgi:adenosylmethionine-8-amino-7-oxononanoate aminotransferase